MKKVLISLFVIFTCTTNIVAQSKDSSEYIESEQLQGTNNENKPCVVFSKFKLDWFNIMGIRGGGDGQRLKLVFKNKSTDTFKYITVHYWPVNSVNDITEDRFNRKEFSVKCTGPFSPGDNTKLEVQIALFHPNLLKAYPYKVDITYMDGEEREIEINKKNINSIFPCVEYINVGGIE